MRETVEREEREIPKTLIYSCTYNSRYRRGLKKLPSVMINIRIPKHKSHVVDGLEEIARRERVTISDVVRAALEEYVKKHREGNPQFGLFPKSVEPEVFPLEKRMQNVEWLKNLVKANPGRSDLFWCHQFSEIAGLNPKTVKEYLSTLLITGSLVRRGGRLYHRDNVPT